MVGRLSLDRMATCTWGWAMEGRRATPQAISQSLDTLLGKILRIVWTMAILCHPPDNPFAGGGGRAGDLGVWLRNPWRISFDRLTGDLYIGDVRQNQIED
jgi:hypothetical protein